eukprot:3080987-Pleurochrysis_carterae.AAC.2
MHLERREQLEVFLVRDRKQRADACVAASRRKTRGGATALNVTIPRREQVTHEEYLSVRARGRVAWSEGSSLHAGTCQHVLHARSQNGSDLAP